MFIDEIAFINKRKILQFLTRSLGTVIDITCSAINIIIWDFPVFQDTYFA